MLASGPAVFMADRAAGLGWEPFLLARLGAAACGGSVHFRELEWVVSLTKKGDVDMGYLKHRCSNCGRRIYIKEDKPGVWLAYKSWVAGDVEEGVWELHLCGGQSTGVAHPAASAEFPDWLMAPSPRQQLISKLAAQFRRPEQEIDGVVKEVEAMLLKERATGSQPPQDDDDIPF